MIQEMITKLMEEANEEAEHKGWCDTEFSTNEQASKEKTAAGRHSISRLVSLKHPLQN